MLETAREALSCSSTDPPALERRHSSCENCLNQALSFKSECSACGQLTSRKDVTKYHAIGTLVASVDRFQKFLGHASSSAPSPPTSSLALLPVNESPVRRKAVVSKMPEEEVAPAQADTARHVLVENTCREEEPPASPHAHTSSPTTVSILQQQPWHRQRQPAERGGRGVVPDSLQLDEQEQEQEQEETQTQTETQPERETQAPRYIKSRPSSRVLVADTYDEADFYRTEEEEEEEEEPSGRGLEKEETEGEGTLRETSSKSAEPAGYIIDEEMSGSERDAAVNMAGLVAEIEQELAQAEAAACEARKRRRMCGVL